MSDTKEDIAHIGPCDHAYKWTKLVRRNPIGSREKYPFKETGQTEFCDIDHSKYSMFEFFSVDFSEFPFCGAFHHFL